MVPSCSWSSSPWIALPQSTDATAARKPSILIARISTRNSTNANSPSPKFSFQSNHRSCIRTLNCCAASSSTVEQDESSSSMVLIKGMSRSTTEGQLRKVFSEFGEVTQVKIIRDKESEESLGYGFIWFSGRESADLAVREMNGKFFRGRFILVTVAKPRLPQRQERTIPYRF